MPGLARNGGFTGTSPAQEGVGLTLSVNASPTTSPRNAGDASAGLISSLGPAEAPVSAPDHTGTMTRPTELTRRISNEPVKRLSMMAVGSPFSGGATTTLRRSGTSRPNQPGVKRTQTDAHRRQLSTQGAEDESTMSALFEQLKAKQEEFFLKYEREGLDRESLDVIAALGLRHYTDFTRLSLAEWHRLEALRSSGKLKLTVPVGQKIGLRPALQGDASAYTPTNIIRRLTLLYDDVVVRVTEVWWNLLKSPEQDAIDEESWMRILLLVKAHLDPAAPPDQAFTSAKRDWIVDSEATGSLNRSKLHRALFELADTWTPSISALDYAQFLAGLLFAITVPPENKITSLQQPLLLQQMSRRASITSKAAGNPAAAVAAAVASAISQAVSMSDTDASTSSKATTYVAQRSSIASSLTAKSFCLTFPISSTVFVFAPQLAAKLAAYAKEVGELKAQVSDPAAIFWSATGGHDDYETAVMTAAASIATLLRSPHIAAAAAAAGLSPSELVAQQGTALFNGSGAIINTRFSEETMKFLKTLPDESFSVLAQFAPLLSAAIDQIQTTRARSLTTKDPSTSIPLISSTLLAGYVYSTTEPEGKRKGKRDANGRANEMPSLLEMSKSGTYTTVPGAINTKLPSISSHSIVDTRTPALGRLTSSGAASSDETFVISFDSPYAPTRSTAATSSSTFATRALLSGAGSDASTGDALAAIHSGHSTAGDGKQRNNALVEQSELEQERPEATIARLSGLDRPDLAYLTGPLLIDLALSLGPGDRTLAQLPPVLHRMLAAHVQAGGCFAEVGYLTDKDYASIVPKSRRRAHFQTGSDTEGFSSSDSDSDTTPQGTPLLGSRAPPSDLAREDAALNKLALENNAKARLLEKALSADGLILGPSKYAPPPTIASTSAQLHNVASTSLRKSMVAGGALISVPRESQPASSAGGPRPGLATSQVAPDLTESASISAVLAVRSKQRAEATAVFASAAKDSSRTLLGAGDAQGDILNQVRSMSGLSASMMHGRPRDSISSVSSLHSGRRGSLTTSSNEDVPSLSPMTSIASTLTIDSSAPLEGRSLSGAKVSTPRSPSRPSQIHPRRTSTMRSAAPDGDKTLSTPGALTMGQGSAKLKARTLLSSSISNRGKTRPGLNVAVGAGVNVALDLLGVVNGTGSSGSGSAVMLARGFAIRRQLLLSASMLSRLTQDMMVLSGPKTLAQLEAEAKPNFVGRPISASAAASTSAFHQTGSSLLSTATMNAAQDKLALTRATDSAFAANKLSNPVQNESATLTLVSHDAVSATQGRLLAPAQVFPTQIEPLQTQEGIYRALTNEKLPAQSKTDVVSEIASQAAESIGQKARTSRNTKWMQVTTMAQQQQSSMRSNSTREALPTVSETPVLDAPLPEELVAGKGLDATNQDIDNFTAAALRAAEVIDTTLDWTRQVASSPDRQSILDGDTRSSGAKNMSATRGQSVGGFELSSFGDMNSFTPIQQNIRHALSVRTDTASQRGEPYSRGELRTPPPPTQATETSFWQGRAVKLVTDNFGGSGSIDSTMASVFTTQHPRLNLAAPGPVDVALSTSAVATKETASVGGVPIGFLTSTPAGATAGANAGSAAAMLGRATTIVGGEADYARSAAPLEAVRLATLQAFVPELEFQSAVFDKSVSGAQSDILDEAGRKKPAQALLSLRDPRTARYATRKPETRSQASIPPTPQEPAQAQKELGDARSRQPTPTFNYTSVFNLKPSALTPSQSPTPSRSLERSPKKEGRRLHESPSPSRRESRSLSPLRPRHTPRSPNRTPSPSKISDSTERRRQRQLQHTLDYEAASGDGAGDLDHDELGFDERDRASFGTQRRDDDLSGAEGDIDEDPRTELGPYSYGDARTRRYSGRDVLTHSSSVQDLRIRGSLQDDDIDDGMGITRTRFRAQRHNSIVGAQSLSPVSQLSDDFDLQSGRRGDGTYVLDGVHVELQSDDDVDLELQTGIATGRTAALTSPTGDRPTSADESMLSLDIGSSMRNYESFDPTLEDTRFSTLRSEELAEQTEIIRLWLPDIALQPDSQTNGLTSTVDTPPKLDDTPTAESSKPSTALDQWTPGVGTCTAASGLLALDEWHAGAQGGVTDRRQRSLNLRSFIARRALDAIYAALAKSKPQVVATSDVVRLASALRLALGYPKRRLIADRERRLIAYLASTDAKKRPLLSEFDVEFTRFLSQGFNDNLVHKRSAHITPAPPELVVDTGDEYAPVQDQVEADEEDVTAPQHDEELANLAKGTVLSAFTEAGWHATLKRVSETVSRSASPLLSRPPSRSTPLGNHDSKRLTPVMRTESPSLSSSSAFRLYRMIRMPLRDSGAGEDTIDSDDDEDDVEDEDDFSALAAERNTRRDGKQIRISFRRFAPDWMILDQGTLVLDSASSSQSQTPLVASRTLGGPADTPPKARPKMQPIKYSNYLLPLSSEVSVALSVQPSRAFLPNQSVVLVPRFLRRQHGIGSSLVLASRPISHLPTRKQLVSLGLVSEAIASSNETELYSEELLRWLLRRSIRFRAGQARDGGPRRVILRPMPYLWEMIELSCDSPLLASENQTSISPLTLRRRVFVQTASLGLPLSSAEGSSEMPRIPCTRVWEEILIEEVPLGKWGCSPTSLIQPFIRLAALTSSHFLRAIEVSQECAQVADRAREEARAFGTATNNNLVASSDGLDSSNDASRSSWLWDANSVYLTQFRSKADERAYHMLLEILQKGLSLSSIPANEVPPYPVVFSAHQRKIETEPTTSEHPVVWISPLTGSTLNETLMRHFNSPSNLLSEVSREINDLSSYISKLGAATFGPSPWALPPTGPLRPLHWLGLALDSQLVRLQVVPLCQIKDNPNVNSGRAGSPSPIMSPTSFGIYSSTTPPPRVSTPGCETRGQSEHPSTLVLVADVQLSSKVCRWLSSAISQNADDLYEGVKIKDSMLGILDALDTPWPMWSPRYVAYVMEALSDRLAAVFTRESGCTTVVRVLSIEDQDDAEDSVLDSSENEVEVVDLSVNTGGEQDHQELPALQQQQDLVVSPEPVSSLDAYSGSPLTLDMLSPVSTRIESVVPMGSPQCISIGHPHAGPDGFLPPLPSASHPDGMQQRISGEHPEMARLDTKPGQVQGPHTSASFEQLAGMNHSSRSELTRLGLKLSMVLSPSSRTLGSSEELSSTTLDSPILSPLEQFSSHLVPSALARSGDATPLSGDPIARLVTRLPYREYHATSDQQDTQKSSTEELQALRPKTPGESPSMTLLRNIQSAAETAKARLTEELRLNVLEESDDFDVHGLNNEFLQQMATFGAKSRSGLVPPGMFSPRREAPASLGSAHGSLKGLRADSKAAAIADGVATADSQPTFEEPPSRDSQLQALSSSIFTQLHLPEGFHPTPEEEKLFEQFVVESMQKMGVHTILADPSTPKIAPSPNDEQTAKRIATISGGAQSAAILLTNLTSLVIGKEPSTIPQPIDSHRAARSLEAALRVLAIDERIAKLAVALNHMQPPKFNPRRRVPRARSALRNHPELPKHAVETHQDLKPIQTKVFNFDSLAQIALRAIASRAEAVSDDSSTHLIDREAHKRQTDVTGGLASHLEPSLKLLWLAATGNYINNPDCGSRYDKDHVRVLPLFAQDPRWLQSPTTAVSPFVPQKLVEGARMSHDLSIQGTLLSKSDTVAAIMQGSSGMLSMAKPKLGQHEPQQFPMVHMPRPVIQNSIPTKLAILGLPVSTPVMQGDLMSTASPLLRYTTHAQGNLIQLPLMKSAQTQTFAACAGASTSEPQKPICPLQKSAPRIGSANFAPGSSRNKTARARATTASLHHDVWKSPRQFIATESDKFQEVEVGEERIVKLPVSNNSGQSNGPTTVSATMPLPLTPVNPQPQGRNPLRRNHTASISTKRTHPAFSRTFM